MFKWVTWLFYGKLESKKNQDTVDNSYEDILVVYNKKSESHKMKLMNQLEKLYQDIQDITDMDFIDVESILRRRSILLEKNDTIPSLLILIRDYQDMPMYNNILSQNKKLRFTTVTLLTHNQLLIHLTPHTNTIFIFKDSKTQNKTSLTIWEKLFKTCNR